MGLMTGNFLDESLALLSRTPAALEALLRGLPAAWTNVDEGPGTWTPYGVVGHLAHTERVDWMPRLLRILDDGPDRPFDPVDREAQLKEGSDRPLDEILDEFVALRRANLVRLRALNLQPVQLELEGTHPTLGRVTVRQLLSTWTAHDLAHLIQVSRTMAKRYRQEVGPFAQFLSVMK
jgi:hypothetical protein